MKILHTSDLHIASALSTRLPANKVAARKRELLGNLAKLCAKGMELGVSAMVIAGDLFDSEKVTVKELDSTLAIIERAENMTFFYLPGNHEKNVISASGEALPKNLLIFGEDWTYFRMGNITVAGRSTTSKDMFDTLNLDPLHKNVVVLHGELRDKSDENGIIGLNDAKNKNIDYMALGHYHTYSSHTIDKRGHAVYCGTPEGRGFDEVGDLGFCTVNVTADSVTHLFHPFAQRKMIIKDIDITGALRTAEVERLVNRAIYDIEPEHIVRVNLVGARELELRLDKTILQDRFSERFYHFEIKDSSKLLTRAEDYLYDKSLRGEFIRLVLADETLDENEKEKIIHCALAALAGEAFDE